jgi:hypothetical protein
MAEKMDADDTPDEMTKEEKEEYELAIRSASDDAETSRSLSLSMAQEEKYGNLVQKSEVKTNITKKDDKPASNSLIMLSDEKEPAAMDA